MPTFGRYEILFSIASGGMAEVFAARAIGADGFSKDVVVKRILDAFASDPEFRKMFVDEARIGSTLNHANIVQVLDYGHVDDTLFIAMERVDGADVGRVIEAARVAGRPVPMEIALFIVSEALKGLDYAHRRERNGKSMGIVHRDVSPQNILVSWEGEVRVGDFGIAAAYGRERFTQAGHVRGKPQYMAPEQANDRMLDARTDVFAAGLVLHELLTGKPVFQGMNEAEVLDRVEAARIASPSSLDPRIPPDLDRIVMTALARIPRDRYSGAGAFQRAIEDYALERRLRMSSTSLAEFLRAIFPEARRARSDSDEVTAIFTHDRDAEGTPHFSAGKDAAKLADRSTTKPSAPPDASTTAPSAAPPRPPARPDASTVLAAKRPRATDPWGERLLLALAVAGLLVVAIGVIVAPSLSSSPSAPTPSPTTEAPVAHPTPPPSIAVTTPSAPVAHRTAPLAASASSPAALAPALPELPPTKAYLSAMANGRDQEDLQAWVAARRHYREALKAAISPDQQASAQAALERTQNQCEKAAREQISTAKAYLGADNCAFANRALTDAESYVEGPDDPVAPLVDKLRGEVARTCPRP